MENEIKHRTLLKSALLLPFAQNLPDDTGATDKKFETAKREALAQIERGLIAGAVFGTANGIAACGTQMGGNNRGKKKNSRTPHRITRQAVNAINLVNIKVVGVYALQKDCLTNTYTNIIFYHKPRQILSIY